MPANQFLIPNKVRKKTHTFPEGVRQRIAKALLAIRANPVSGTKLHGELDVYYKVRVGDYRIIYRFRSQESLVEIIKIEHRQGVYK